MAKRFPVPPADNLRHMGLVGVDIVEPLSSRMRWQPVDILTPADMRKNMFCTVLTF